MLLLRKIVKLLLALLFLHISIDFGILSTNFITFFTESFTTLELKFCEDAVNPDQLIYQSLLETKTSSGHF